MVDLNKLRHAVAIAREGSFAAAATQIPMSQSALTRSIQVLERSYGVTLFERGKNGSRLTAEGADFILAAEEILWGAEHADERLQAIASGQAATVRFGAGPLMIASVLPEVISQLASTGLRFQVRTGSSSTLRALLSQGEIDFFIGGAPRGADYFSTAHGFKLAPLGAETREIEVFMRKGHPLDNVEGGEVAATSDYPVACDSYLRSQLGTEGFEALGFQQPSFEIDDYRVLIGLVRHSDFLLMANRGVRTIVSPGDIVVRTIRAPAASTEWIWAVISSSRGPLSNSAQTVADYLSAQILQNDVTSNLHEGRTSPKVVRPEKN